MSYEIINASILDAEPEGLFDAVLCDPPYGLEFMGKGWDRGVPGAEFWERIAGWCKPGAHLMAFGGTRTAHRLVCAIEDAGWTIRDSLCWLYGSGFPKNLDISKAIDKATVVQCPDCDGKGVIFEKTGVQAGLCPRCAADEGGMYQSGLDFCVDCGTQITETRDEMWPRPCARCNATGKARGAEREVVGSKTRPDGTKRPNAGEWSDGMGYRGNPATSKTATAPGTPDAIRWDGQGTALKPAHEPICLARKPLSGTVAANCLEHGCGGLNIEGGRIRGDYETRDRETNGGASMFGTGAGGGAFVPAEGRWPANLILDESAAAQLDKQSGERAVSGAANSGRPATARNKGMFFDAKASGNGTLHNDTGGASRFFYTAKASASERNAGLDGRQTQNVNDGRKTSIDNPYQRGDTQRRNVHPTVKPIDLCRYLATLLLPPPVWRSQQHEPRRILVPFSGSGSEMIGACLAGWEHVVGIELDPEYCSIAEARLEHWTRQPELFAAAGMASQLEIE